MELEKHERKEILVRDQSLTNACKRIFLFLINYNLKSESEMKIVGQKQNYKSSIMLAIFFKNPDRFLMVTRWLPKFHPLLPYPTIRSGEQEVLGEADSFFIKIS
jgi:hypothetical protein